MYLIVNSSLGMSCGKIAAQCGHAVQLLLEQYYSLLSCNIKTEDQQKKIDRVELWKAPELDGGYRKVVLQAGEKEWEYLKKAYNPIIVIDAGLTEVSAGSETVMVLYPMFKEEECSKLKRLQCLK